ncbi:hypothetical protein [Candidatus Mycobacterium methanotrophicum]|uniref:hypothetical protein n=1 Tax=Candidatus Mycobacterium methanotrophicum TaxID=2943498 RepID=UPI001C585975|nr:hypothetical protein [Candidatus Mycobacterium methanotrophicum]
MPLARGYRSFIQPRGVGALDIVHRNRQFAIELAAIVRRDNIRVPKRRGQIGFAVESCAVLAIGRQGSPLSEVSVSNKLG